jgi:hypothetical protein
MLTQEEQEFMAYWRLNRKKQKKIFWQFALGIPVGLLFAIPILVNFASGWYKRAAMQANTTDFNPGVLLVALLLIVGFVAVFSKRFQWEKNEQRYLELDSKQKNEQSSDPEITQDPSALS